LIRRILETARERSIHPIAGDVCRLHDSVAAATPEDLAVLWVADDERMPDIAAPQILAHVELAGIPRRGNGLGNAEELDHVAVADFAAPPGEDRCVRLFSDAVALIPLHPQMKRRHAAFRDLRFRSDDSRGCKRDGPSAELALQPKARSLGLPQAVEREERRCDEAVCRAGAATFERERRTPGQEQEAREGLRPYIRNGDADHRRES
jgi:hypothetical protein